MCHAVTCYCPFTRLVFERVDIPDHKATAAHGWLWKRKRKSMAMSWNGWGKDQASGCFRHSFCCKDHCYIVRFAVVTERHSWPAGAGWTIIGDKGHLLQGGDGELVALLKGCIYFVLVKAVISIRLMVLVDGGRSTTDWLWPDVWETFHCDRAKGCGWNAFIR